MNTKTPWDPSIKAANRVANALPVPTECHLCGGEVSVRHHDEIYGRVYGDWPWLYRCDECDARVGMHPFTNIPLGTLADAETRRVRQECKTKFYGYLNAAGIKRGKGYKQLAKAMGITPHECHFGWFDISACKNAERAIDRLTDEAEWM